VIRSFSVPIYITFFVLIGARLSLKSIPLWNWALVIAYILMRSTGKWVGAYWGSRVSHAEKTVKDYLGMALFAQGGVAVGLSIVASHHLRHIQVVEDMSLGDMIIFTVTATTLCVQVIGPLFAKLAIKCAGETGRKVTEDDVMTEWNVIDVMNTKIAPLQEATSVETVAQNFAEQDTFVYPVVSKGGKISGVLTFDMLKDVLVDRDTWKWLIVGDVMQPVHDRLIAKMNLGEALLEMQNMQADALPVVESPDNDKLLGVLVLREARQKIGAEIIRRQTSTA
jgi:CBS-domain-containing membrane protein